MVVRTVSGVSLDTGTERLHPVQRVLGRVVADLDGLDGLDGSGSGGSGLWSLGDREVDALLTGLVRAGDRLRVQVLELVGEAERRNRAADAGATSHRAWLAQLLHVVPGEAGRMITAAAILAAAAKDPVTAPLTNDARTGHVPVEQAVIGAAAVAALPGDLCQEQRVAAVVVLRAKAQEFDPTQLRAFTDHLLGLIDPDRGDAREEERLRREERRAHALRELVIGSPLNGMVRGRFQLPTADATVIRTALDALAKPCPTVSSEAGVDADPDATPAHAIVPPEGDQDTEVPTAARDERTYARRMLDALLELARRSLAGDDLPDTGGHRPQMIITIDLERLRLGIGAATTPDGTVTGTPISAATARRAACDAGILPAVLGTTGQPLDIGRETRVIPTAIRRALVLRDHGCTFPGCTRPPSWTDAHHLRHWADGGPTSLTNLALLCGHHHRTVHTRNWTARTDPHGGPPHWHPPGTPAPNDP